MSEKVSGRASSRELRVRVLSAETLAELDAVAHRRERSRSAEARVAIREHLRRAKAEAA